MKYQNIISILLFIFQLHNGVRANEFQNHPPRQRPKDKLLQMPPMPSYPISQTKPITFNQDFNINKISDPFDLTSVTGHTIPIEIIRDLFPTEDGTRNPNYPLVTLLKGEHKNMYANNVFPTELNIFTRNDFHTLASVMDHRNTGAMHRLFKKSGLGNGRPVQDVPAINKLHFNRLADSFSNSDYYRFHGFGDQISQNSFRQGVPVQHKHSCYNCQEKAPVLENTVQTLGHFHPYYLSNPVSAHSMYQRHFL